MNNTNVKKGIIFGVFSAFTISLQPIISILRPSIIDPFLFAMGTALLEAILFFPLYYYEIRKYKRLEKLESSNQPRYNRLINGWKKKENIRMLIFIGITFSIVPVLLYIGYELAGAILSSLTMKTEIIFALVFGYLFLNEKITKKQIIFCILLFFGLIFAITQGTFNILEFNFGVLILILSVALFTLIHTLTKSRFDRDEFFPSQVVFIRNALSGIILLIFYLIVFPLENLAIMFEPINFFFFFLMALVYGISLFLWYKTLSYIQIGKASIIVSITPIITAFYSFIFLGEIFTWFHLVGTVIIIFSIYMIVRQKNK